MASEWCATTTELRYNKRMKLLAGSSNPDLATALSATLSTPLVSVEISKFANGEKRVRIAEQLAGEDVVIVQSLTEPVDEQIIELLLLIDAVERLGVHDVHLLVPWLGYSLQDKVFLPGEPIAAKVIANLISNSYVRRTYLLDVHNTSIPGFFSVPTVHLSATDLFVADVKERFAGQEVIVASPDFGGLKRARQFAALLECPLVNINKHRDLQTGEVTAVEVHGSVAGKKVIMFDDVIVSGGTVKETAELLKNTGAEEVHFYASHGLFVGQARELIADAPVDSLTITNSIYHAEPLKKVRVLDVSQLFAQAIEGWL